MLQRGGRVTSAPFSCPEVLGRWQGNIAFFVVFRFREDWYNYKKLVDKDGRFAAGMIAKVDKGAYGFVDVVFVEEPLRHRGLGTYLLQEVEKLAKKNNASMVLTNAGDWNVVFFKKIGYVLRGELKDVPKGHTCYELYKMIRGNCRSSIRVKQYRR